MLSIPLLLGIIAAVLVGWFWQDSLGARERANRAALEACTRMNLQFLDGTVAFARMGFARNEGGQLRLRRTYVFDYVSQEWATSIERRQGFVVMLGMRVESVGFEQEQPPDQRKPRLEDAGPVDPDTSNVLDLNEWRQRRSKQLKPPEDRSSSPGDNGW